MADQWMTDISTNAFISRIEIAFDQENWKELSNLLSPPTLDVKKQIFNRFAILAKVAQILTTEKPVAPNYVKIACLKCLGNSCLYNRKHKEYAPESIEQGTFCHKLYSFLANTENLEEIEKCYSDSLESYFPYQGVIGWTSNFIISYKGDINLINDDLEVLRLSIQFLCHLFTFVYEHNNSPDMSNALKCLYDNNLKDVIINVTHSEHRPLVIASCAFIHNILRKFEGQTFTDTEKIHLCSQLLKPTSEGVESAKDALELLEYKTNIFQHAYDNMSIGNKLCFLEIIYGEMLYPSHNSEGQVFCKDTVEFCIERFCKRSDLILKTADTCLDEEDVREIVFLLDILGTLTSKTGKERSIFKDHKSLLINCTHLLKCIQLIGNESKNYFTPLQKLSEVVPAVQKLSIDEGKDVENKAEEGQINLDLYSHPAFGFKAGLIRIIGNMSYQNKDCQDLLRDMDAVPLLLDCCNIDARNPLIMQWTILALRNLCENNPTNQEIIRNCTRVGVVESSVLREMGVTLHEDDEGKKIGIVPLPREGK